MRGLLRPIKKGLSRLMLGLSSPFARALSLLVPGNAAYSAFARHGFHLLRKHYYAPIPDEQELADPLVKEPTALVGIDLNESGALRLLRDVVAGYQEEFRQAFPLHQPTQETGFYLINGGFMAGDAQVYYALIRQGKPRRIIEIGGGFSSLLAAAACLRNEQEFGIKPHLTVIEPYPSDHFRAGFPGLDQLIEERLQKVDMKLFTSLEAGDICFIDSTHVLRPGNDVHREYCEILPRLAAGVLVHIHDISLPKPYFPFYFQNHLYWNEQYLLQAFLAFNSRFEVVWPGTYMFMKHPDELLRVFPDIKDMRKEFPLAEPSSFWLRVRNP